MRIPYPWYLIKLLILIVPQVISNRHCLPSARIVRSVQPESSQTWGFLLVISYTPMHTHFLLSCKSPLVLVMLRIEPSSILESLLPYRNNLLTRIYLHCFNFCLALVLLNSCGTITQIWIRTTRPSDRTTRSPSFHQDLLSPVCLLIWISSSESDFNQNLMLQINIYWSRE